MKDNAENKRLIKEAVENGNYADLEQLLMQDAIDSGELTKAFASAWVNKTAGGQDGGAQEQQAASVQTQGYQDAGGQKASKPKVKRGVSING